MNKELEELLNDIRNWMIENDYECGERGGELFDRIDKILKTDSN
jgi:hypothetical protein